MLHIQQLHKAYGSHTILQLEEITLSPGVYWIKGQNGAGKTTLFRCLAGMLPFQGEVWLDDAYHPRQHPSAYRQRVNYGEAEPQFPAFLTGHDLMHMVAEAKQAPPDQLTQLCEALGVGEYRHQRISTYSSGMLKKVSLVMALLGQPRWVFLDEPLITLDPEAQEHLLHLVDQGQQQGISYLLSSHQAWSTDRLPLTGQFHLHQQKLLPL